MKGLNDNDSVDISIKLYTEFNKDGKFFKWVNKIGVYAKDGEVKILCL